MHDAFVCISLESNLKNLRSLDDIPIINFETDEYNKKLRNFMPSNNKILLLLYSKKI